MTRITAPGIYTDFPATAYHADPCPEPSLSASMAKILLNASPRHAWTAHPRLNPAFVSESDGKMDFGSVAHELLLCRGAGIVTVDADSWRTKAAQEQRAEAEAKGKTAILMKDYEAALTMVASARVQLDGIEDCHDAFQEPEFSEQMLAWNEGGTWFRNLADYIAPKRPTGHIVCYDYKTTSASAAPHAVAMHLYNMEYEVQAAMLERGLEHLIGDVAGRIVFRFVVQEREPPHALTVVELDRAGWMMGRKKLAAAVVQWQRCMESGNWPGYPSKIVRAELPEFMENKWLRREENPHDMASLEGDSFLNLSPWMPKPKPSVPTLGD